MRKSGNTKTEAFEKTLFKAADKLRKNMDAAEYKHIVLGLIFLKYISDSFEELHIKIKEGKGDFAGANPEDADEYRAENVFFVPRAARWSYLHSRAMLLTIGKGIDDAISNSHFDAVILANARIHLIWGSLDTRLRGYDVK